MSPQTPPTQWSADDTLVRAPVPPEPEPGTSRPSGRAKLVLAGVLGLLVVGVLAVYGIGFMMAGDRLPRNAVISGVSVGGLELASAEEKLRTELGPQAEQPIEVVVNDEESTVEPGGAGLSVDYAASVEQAGGGKSLDPRQIWRVLTGGSATDAVVEVDEDKLTAAVASLAQEVDAEPKDATLAYDGSAIEKGSAVDGVALLQEDAARDLQAAYLAGDEPVTLVADVTEPDITTAEVNAVIRSFARPAVSAPVKVEAGAAGDFEVTRRMIGESITFAPKDGTLAPSLDAERLREVADDAVSTVELKKPKNATVKIVDGEPKVIPAVNGTTVGAEQLAQAVEPVLTKEGKDRTTEVELTGAQAKFSAEEAEALGVKKVTGEFTTYFPYAQYRNVNIGRAAELINNTLLKPGETFSLNETVGERTAANGFVEGFIIKGGRLREELGGGVSQSATTTFNAMFFAGLQDVEHQPHTLYFDRYPAGREATVAWPSLDLKFKNDTKYGVLVQAYVKKSTPSSRGSITVKMWSSPTYDEVKSSKLRKSNFTTGRDITDDGSKCVPQVPTQGFDVNYERLFYNDDKLVKTEDFRWRYAPTDRVRCE